MRTLWILLVGLSLVLGGCHGQNKTLKIAATPVPHAEILEVVKPILEDEGINLKIVEVDDYNLPNRLLAEQQVDANFFQHLSYLEEQNRRFGYRLVPLLAVHIEPLGIYSEKITSLDDLKEGGKVAIPNDPANEARALTLLSQVGLIRLKPHEDLSLVTVYDIKENPKNLKINEIEAAFLPRALPDVELAIIPSNFALQAGLNPSKDALALESSDSLYANLVVIRKEDQAKPELLKLKEALQSEVVQKMIREKYQGAIVPAGNP